MREIALAIVAVGFSLGIVLDSYLTPARMGSGDHFLTSLVIFACVIGIFKS